MTVTGNGYPMRLDRPTEHDPPVGTRPRATTPTLARVPVPCTDRRASPSTATGTPTSWRMTTGSLHRVADAVRLDPGDGAASTAGRRRARRAYRQWQFAEAGASRSARPCRPGATAPTVPTPDEAVGRRGLRTGEHFLGQQLPVARLCRRREGWDVYELPRVSTSQPDAQRRIRTTDPAHDPGQPAGRAGRRLRRRRCLGSPGPTWTTPRALTGPRLASSGADRQPDVEPAGLPTISCRARATTRPT